MFLRTSIMKQLITGLLLCAGLGTLQAQNRPKADTLRVAKDPNVRKTDSVRSGTNLFEGGRGKSRSQGDTLAPRHQSGTHEKKAPRSENP